MNHSTYQTVPVTCPKCNYRFVSPVLTLIDASENPNAKALFLAGQINVAACPQCGHAGVLSAPLVYHDPEKELLFTHVPAELALTEVEQQRIIGDMTNRVMMSLPVEERKGYLLRPRSFLRLEGMVEAVLEADGITPEMLQAQRAKAALLERLMRAASVEARQLIAQENDEQIDYEFFEILTLNIQLAQANGAEETSQQLLRLRRELLGLTTAGREVAAREEAIKELGRDLTREGLLQKLIEAAMAGEQVKVETMVALARPAIDYTFYQLLTERIQAAEQAAKDNEAKTLTDLREDVLALTAEVDAEVQKASQRAAQLLQRILQSNNPEQTIRANLASIDEVFLSVLAMNLRAAEQSDRDDDLERLQEIDDILMKLIQESQPPEIQFINELLGADYPDGTRELLEENRQEVDSQLLEIMRLVGEDLARSDRQELADRLTQIREQAASMVGQVSLSSRD